MKKLLRIMVLTFAASALLFVSASVVSAAEIVDQGTCGDNLTWVLDDGGTLTISGQGAMKSDPKSAPWKDYSESVYQVVVEEGVTSIMDKLKSAFATEDSVLALIKQNTYTKSEIDALIESAQPSSSSAWEDGTEISLFPGQSLPITSEPITIESISAKKYRNAQIDERCVNCPYRIAWKISGSFSCTEDWFRRSSTSIEFRAYNGDCSAGSTYVHVPKDTVKINGNSFEFETTENTMTVGDRLLLETVYMED